MIADVISKFNERLEKEIVGKIKAGTGMEDRLAVKTKDGAGIEVNFSLGETIQNDNDSFGVAVMYISLSSLHLVGGTGGKVYPRNEDMAEHTELEKLINLIRNINNNVLSVEIMDNGFGIKYLRIDYKINKIFMYQVELLNKLIELLTNTKCIEGLDISMLDSDLIMFKENFFNLEKSYLELTVPNKRLCGLQVDALKNILITIEKFLTFYNFKLVESNHIENEKDWKYYSIVMVDDTITDSKDVVAEIYKKQIGEDYAISTYT